MSRFIHALVLLLSLAACAPTEGAEAPFDIVVESMGIDAEGFETRTGWHISLEEAELTLSAIYLWQNPPPLALRQRPSLWDLVVPRALAHAGDLHFSGGAVLGEHLGTLHVDLFQTPIALGERMGNEGRVQSFSVFFDSSTSFVARLKGSASKDGQLVRFESLLKLSAGRESQVNGLSTDGVIENGATFVLGVNLPRWFQDADFTSLVVEDPDEVQLITDGSQVRAALFLGARSHEAFTGTWRSSIP